MRVLVSEAAPGDAVEVLGRLRAAGHAVVTCRGGARCPLAADGTCPLADGLVDVVVHVRARPGALSDHDRPFQCGVVAGVPTVLCGYPAAEGPWSRADAHCSPAGIVAAVGNAARPTSGAARRRVEKAVAEVLRPHRLPPPRRVDITVDHSVVSVSLTFDRRLPVIVREQLRPAVRSALAAFSPYWAYARVAVLADVPATAGPGAGRPAE